MKDQKVEAPEVIEEIALELALLVNSSVGADLTLSEAELVKQSYIPFYEIIGEIKELSKKINWENPTELDEKIAKDLRMRTVKVRTGSAEVKDGRKRKHLLMGNLEQAAYNLVKASCEVEEDRFLQVEKYRENKERARIDALRISRTEECREYREFVPYGIDVAIMPDEEYDKFLSGLKTQMDAKVRREKEEAEEAEAKKKIDADHTFRKGLAIEVWSFFPEDLKTSNLGEMSEKDWKKTLKNAMEAKAAHIIEQEKLKKENDALLAKQEEERLAAQKKNALSSERYQQLLPFSGHGLPVDYTKLGDMSDEEFANILNNKRDAFDTHNAEEAERQKKIDEENRLKDKAFKKAESEKAALQAKIDADNLEKEKVRKAKEAADKAALLAPDKLKLTALAKTFSDVQMPELKTPEAVQILTNIKTLQGKLTNYIIEQSEKL